MAVEKIDENLFFGPEIVISRAGPVLSASAIGAGNDIISRLG